ncbi:hypothetical protein BDF22DRAFT_689823 [Syncephalis plumigaleata]|nr:hypothetical protein BDF22DRAFT_689823 [Syncephalis plumigaleata]
MAITNVPARASTSYMRIHDDDDDDDDDDDSQNMELEKMFSTDPYSNSSSPVMSYPPSSSTITNFKMSTPATSSRFDYYGYGSQRKRTGPVGTTGLQNLGNTCFMNSALQCLSNTRALTAFFLDGSYRKDINRDNPLGMQGRIADVYGDLLKHLWKDSVAYVAPREFKSVLQRFAPQFSGYQQHDSQEFIAFLLDGLHEDLNRVRVKPYIEIPDADDRPDNEVAEERWQIHKARNDSKVVDEFQGQYKSTLVCPECNKVSVTFDPFMYLTLPVPVIKLRNIVLTFVPLSALARPVKITISVPSNGTIRILKQRIGDAMNVDPDKLEILEEFRSAMHHQFTNSEPLSQIQSVDVIYAYELPCRYPPSSDSNWVVFSVVNQRQGRFKSTELFGVPSIVAIPREDTYSFDKVYRAAVCAAQRYTTADLFKPTEEALNNDDDNDDNNDDKNGTAHDTGDDHDSDAMITEETPASEDLYNNRCIRPLRGLFKMALVEDRYSMLPSYRQSSLVCELGTLQRSRTQDIIDPNAIKKESTTTNTTATTDIIAVTNGSTVNSLTTVSPPISDNEDENKPVSSTADNDEATMMETEPVPLVESGRTIILNWADRACTRFLTTASFHQLQHNLPRPRSVTGDGSELWRVKDQKQVASVQDNNAQGPLTLYRCLDEFTRAEQLGEDDSWYCPQCKEHRQATKKFDLWRLPDTLVVHLKRFGQARGWRDKIDDLVEFPIEGLDLSKWIIGEQTSEDNLPIYDLYGVSNHFGGLGGGHYTAYAKNIATNAWYDFDDSTVTPIAENQIVSQSAYLLFYKRRKSTDNDNDNDDDSWLKNLEDTTKQSDDNNGNRDEDTPMDGESASDNWGSQLPKSTYGPYSEAMGGGWSANISSMVPYVPASNTSWMQSGTLATTDRNVLNSSSNSSNSSTGANLGEAMEEFDSPSLNYVTRSASVSPAPDDGDVPIHTMDQASSAMSDEHAAELTSNIRRDLCLD